MTHIPVLLNEAVEGLNLHSGDTILDATFGGGGHSSLICQRIGPSGQLIAIDADSEARSRAENLPWDCKFELITDNFRNLDKILAESKVSGINGALFDLGLSSFQLDISGRGFTFQKNEPLKMTFGGGKATSGLTAEEIINTWSEESLADIIYGYGGERFAKRIAKGIIERRVDRPLKTTFDLVDVIDSNVPNFYKRGKIHPATKTFQAIRIAVNDELDALREALKKVWPIILPMGRIVVISFHELEDRIVKNFFKAKKIEGECILINKKPITAGKKELRVNPRGRSAKLRIAEKK